MGFALFRLSAHVCPTARIGVGKRGHRGGGGGGRESARKAPLAASHRNYTSGRHSYPSFVRQSVSASDAKSVTVSDHITSWLERDDENRHWTNWEQFYPILSGTDQNSNDPPPSTTTTKCGRTGNVTGPKETTRKKKEIGIGGAVSADLWSETAERGRKRRRRGRGRGKG